MLRVLLLDVMRSFYLKLFKWVLQTELKREKDLLGTRAASAREDNTTYFQVIAVSKPLLSSHRKMDDCWLNDLAPVWLPWAKFLACKSLSSSLCLSSLLAFRFHMKRIL